MPFRSVTLDDLTIDDEASFTPIALYDRLKRALARSQHRFLVPRDVETEGSLNWDRALFLNLTFWSSQGDDGADVLCNDHIPADVVAHVAWHRVVSDRIAAGAGTEPTAATLIFAESIASAFDLYLVGRLLENAPESDFITTQVPLLGEAAAQAGLSETEFALLMEGVGANPERAFEDLRALLLDVVRALASCTSPTQAEEVLERFASHRFEPLLHHFQLSNWILYARAYTAGAPSARTEALVADIDATLRKAPVSLDWLTEHWVG